MSFELVVNSISLGMLYCIITTGFTYTYSVLKFFDISQGAAFLIGAYIGFQAIHIFKLNLVFGIIFVICGCSLWSITIFVVLIAKMKKRGSTPLVMFLATLGLLMVIQSLIASIYGADAKVLLSGSIETISFSGITISVFKIAIIFLGFSSLIFTYFLLKQTNFGIKMKAVSDSSILATIIGIAVHQTQMKVYILGSVFSGLGGVLYGLDRTISPNNGLDVILIAMVAAVVGGVGNIIGGMIGSIVFGVLETFTQYHLSGEWKFTTLFIIFIILISFRKRGILGIEYRST